MAAQPLLSAAAPLRLARRRPDRVPGEARGGSVGVSGPRAASGARRSAERRPRGGSAGRAGAPRAGAGGGGARPGPVRARPAGSEGAPARAGVVLRGPASAQGRPRDAPRLRHPARV